ncbi:GNAT family N-acetyltransferase [Vibrio hepatarius]|uniref:GNAT family N-acetyltransferase n=1 Tax=Vibrio hepatarius TaxID=171383 RepID=UPI001C087A2E|nr:GNAT family N-acetyltransferase [Vibrio hepatarius]MBU2899142.1 GNAT family N-acetyltransferase [Vibrio hepatarius]
MKLVSPSYEYQSAFLSFYQEFENNDSINAEYYREGVDDFDSYVQRLTSEASGINLRHGYVPCSHFWMMDTEENLIGVIRVRHTIDNLFLSFEGGHIGYDIAPSYRARGYGKTMLKLALPIAKSLGISKALITADEKNNSSRGVIEANGGEFIDIVMGKVFPYPIARYWVICKADTCS